MILQWPQITWLVIVAIVTGMTIVMHGQPRKGTYNIFTHMLAVAFGGFILYSGGFFG